VNAFAVQNEQRQGRVFAYAPNVADGFHIAKSNGKSDG
jgi:hypothetical protein